MTIKEKCVSTKEKVALAMAEVLEEEDWNVFQHKVVCSKCQKPYYNSEYFCSKCGNELDKPKGKLEPHIVELLWKAFKKGKAL